MNRYDEIPRKNTTTAIKMLKDVSYFEIDRIAANIC